MQIITGRYEEGYSRNVVYRFLSSARTNWERLVCTLSERIITIKGENRQYRETMMALMIGLSEVKLKLSVIRKERYSMKTINKWKIGIALMLVLVFALQLCMVGNSLASGEVWHCDKDNIDIDTDFCPKCGAARPVSTITDTSQSDTWFCPTCGKELPIDIIFARMIAQRKPYPNMDRGRLEI